MTATTTAPISTTDRDSWQLDSVARDALELRRRELLECTPDLSVLRIRAGKKLKPLSAAQMTLLTQSVTLAYTRHEVTQLTRLIDECRTAFTSATRAVPRSLRARLSEPSPAPAQTINSVLDSTRIAEEVARLAFIAARPDFGTYDTLHYEEDGQTIGRLLTPQEFQLVSEPVMSKTDLRHLRWVIAHIKMAEAVEQKMRQRMAAAGRTYKGNKGKRVPGNGNKGTTEVVIPKVTRDTRRAVQPTGEPTGSTRHGRNGYGRAHVPMTPEQEAQSAATLAAKKYPPVGHTPVQTTKSPKVKPPANKDTKNPAKGGKGRKSS